MISIDTGAYLTSSVRKIFEREEPGILKIMKTKKKFLHSGISPFFGPKLDEDQKKGGLHPNISPVFGAKIT